jgi:hypothetical protein
VLSCPFYGATPRALLRDPAFQAANAIEGGLGSAGFFFGHAVID